VVALAIPQQEDYYYYLKRTNSNSTTNNESKLKQTVNNIIKALKFFGNKLVGIYQNVKNQEIIFKSL